MTRIIIAGGGTGGHIFPAIAIANAIIQLQPNAELLFVGATGKMEMEKVPQAGYKIKGLEIAGYNRSSLIKNIGLPYKLLKSFWQVKNIINSFKPHAVVGVGGYSSFPVLKVAQQKGIPTFIHESNSFAGKSNMFLGKNATAIFVASQGMEQFFPAGKIMVTGNPVRKKIVQSNVQRIQALQAFNLQPQYKTILSVGGSLGAKSINEFIAANLQQFKEMNVQIIWQTGNVEAERFALIAAAYKNVSVQQFINNMDEAYAAADIVISRAGAMAVSELCVVEKPVVFVPFPHAAEDHQTMNARYLVERNAALMVKDSEVMNELFITVSGLLNNADKQTELKNNIKQFAVKNADEIIAAEILKHIKN